MLAVQNRPQFMSRVFTDQAGRQFRMLFLVLVIDGEFKGRLISVEPLVSPSHAQLSGAVSESYGIFCLPIYCPVKEPSTEYVPSFARVVSPYFSIDFLITSQPTRAPAFK
jgi:hypothetical protein